MNHIYTIKHNNFTWYIIDKPTKKQVGWIDKNFKFEKEDLTDCLPPLQRPKLVDRQNYLFMILLFPYYDRKSQKIEASEIDFFIDQNKLILVHDNQLPPIVTLQKECQENNAAREQYLTDGSRLLYEILNRLLHYCFPMLNHISQDIDNAETNILNVYERKKSVITEILRIKRNIVNFRKIMQAHKSVISKLIKCSEKFYSPTYLHYYFNNLVNHTKDIWDFLENYKDTIDALHETHESLLSLRLNQIIKTLTIFSVIVFPLTLFAAIFGMNTMNSMPFVDSPYDFWIVVIIMLLSAILMLGYFKNKKWL